MNTTNKYIVGDGDEQKFSKLAIDLTLINRLSVAHIDKNNVIVSPLARQPLLDTGSDHAFTPQPINVFDNNRVGIVMNNLLYNL